MKFARGEKKSVATRIVLDGCETKDFAEVAAMLAKEFDMTAARGRAWARWVVTQGWVDVPNGWVPKTTKRGKSKTTKTADKSTDLPEVVIEPTVKSNLVEVGHKKPSTQSLLAKIAANKAKDKKSKGVIATA